MKPNILRATPDDTREAAVLVGEFLNEIMSAIGTSGFCFNLVERIDERSEFLDQDDYAVFIARSPRGHPLGFITLYESCAQYPSDPFGIIAEIYVRPEYRRRRIGHRLFEQAKSHARSYRWKCLQLAMPAPVRLNEALSFFESERFLDAGGRKMKLAL